MKTPPSLDGPDDFARCFDVSRETLDDLKLYADLLVKWQKAVNLVAPSTLNQIWSRHMGDSAQILDILDKSDSSPDEGLWLDLGSGGGFPGMVAAILLKRKSKLQFHLVESVGRKCAFLSDVARQTGVNIVVHNCRIENLCSDQLGGDVSIISARALASLERLLLMAAPFMHSSTRAFYFKGREALEEVRVAQKQFDFHWRSYESRTSSDSLILEITGQTPRAQAGRP